MRKDIEELKNSDVITTVSRQFSQTEKAIAKEKEDGKYPVSTSNLPDSD